MTSWIKFLCECSTDKVGGKREEETKVKKRNKMYSRTTEDIISLMGNAITNYLKNYKQY
jgi:hypothetical protein